MKYAMLVRPLWYRGVTYIVYDSVITRAKTTFESTLDIPKNRCRRNGGEAYMLMANQYDKINTVYVLLGYGAETE